MSIVQIVLCLLLLVALYALAAKFDQRSEPAADRATVHCVSVERTPLAAEPVPNAGHRVTC
jgi:hypothetical protein